MYNCNLFAFFCLLTIFAFCSPSRADIWPKSIEQRILSGAAPGSASNSDADSVASIRFRNNQGTVHVCGGFIINKRWVGTAAQCLTGKTINNTVVALGRPTITGGTIYPIIEIQKHQNYNELTLANDIGLLRTLDEIIFGPNVRLIPLGTPILTSYNADMYGWGRVAAAGGLSETIRTSVFTTVSHETCMSRFPFVTRRFINPNRQICFTAFLGTSATCPGDAGGPIIFNNAVVGIISWVEPCVAAQTSVHTRVSFYMNWILRITRDDD